MKTMLVVAALAMVAGCKKDEKKDAPEKEEKKEEVKAKEEPKPDPKEEAKEQPSPVSKEDDGEPKGDPIEEGLDMSWQDETDGCKQTLDAKDEAFLKAYGELCVPALAKVTGCLADKDFVSKVEPAPSGEDVAESLKAQMGTADAAKKTCTEIGAEQLCNYQGRSWANPYDAATLRAMGGAADCAALLGVFPGPLYNTGE